MKQNTHTVSVRLGDRSYDILVERGLLAHLGAEVAARVAGGQAEARLAVIFSDHRTFRLYGKAVVQSLKDADFQVHVQTIQHGEKRKTLARLSAYIRRFLTRPLTGAPSSSPWAAA